MFNWFKKKEAISILEQAKIVEQLTASAEQKDPATAYSIGITNDGRISLKIGNATMRMDRLGCEHFVGHLTSFMNTLPAEGKNDQPKI